MLAPGMEIGNYVVEAELARGGMACLFRVRHRVLGSVHALKVLDPELRAMDEIRSRFLGEGLIGAKLRHPHIVRVTDTVATADVAGLVMDLVIGPTLEKFLREQTKPLTPDQIRDLFLPVLEAMAEAHRAGVIHRDIKPSNILLEERPDGTLFPKVTDFGIAKIAEEARELSRGKAATQVAARMGTPAYMSPEQIRGAREVTVRSDIFSLGATLYEMSTFQLAFDGDTDFAIMEKIVSARYADPELVGTRDATISHAIRKALSSEPEIRFASCEEFAAALTAPPPLSPTPKKTKQTEVSQNSHQKADQNRKATRLWPWLLVLLGLGVTVGGAAALVAFGDFHPSDSYPLGKWLPFRKRPPTATQVKRNWQAAPPFSECLAIPRPERVILTKANRTRRIRDASELQYWFRNVPPQSIDVYLEEGRDSRSLVFELVVPRWDKAQAAIGDGIGEEACYRLGLLLLTEDVGRPMSERLFHKRKSPEYEMLGLRAPSPKAEKLGTLDEVLRSPLRLFDRMQSSVR